jgi:hypothetical protein
VKRFLVIFLLFLLPMQTLWASANSYCQHEESVGTEHFGHHSHEHTASDLDDGDGLGASTDTDCDYCHHACSNIVSASVGAAVIPCRFAPPAADLAQYRSFIADITHPPDI